MMPTSNSIGAAVIVVPPDSSSAENKMAYFLDVLFFINAELKVKQ